MMLTKRLILYLGCSMLVSRSSCFALPRSFGRQPSGIRAERIRRSPNFKDGQFCNLEPAPLFIDSLPESDKGHFSLLSRRNRPAPPAFIPAVKTNLQQLPSDRDCLVWFGHSSYLLQIAGKRFLIDPVFSDHAAPFSFIVKAYPGTTIYRTKDLPRIDYLLITHDHWDHLDYRTVVQLKSKVGKVICPLGVGEHLEYWGYNASQLIELDWYASAELGDGFTLYSVPTRHFSGRWLKRNQTLWSAFVLQIPQSRIFIGGDGGYGRHFGEIGHRFGGFDWAILECGQYNLRWRYMHCFPAEVLQVAHDLKARCVLPVHNSRFTISTHSWDEPLRQLRQLNQSVNPVVLTPRIGELVELSDTSQVFPDWWEGLK